MTLKNAAIAFSVFYESLTFMDLLKFSV